MLLAIISAVLAYRKAKDSGRNAWLWAFIAAATFIGTQLVSYFVMIVALGIVLAAGNSTESDFDKFEILVRILAVVISFVSTWLVLKYLDRVPPSDSFSNPPPPPQNFN